MEKIEEFVQALRVCYRAKNAQDCETCPYSKDGEACDQVSLIGAAKVIEELLKELRAERGAWVRADARMPAAGEDVLVYCTHEDLAPWQQVARREKTRAGAEIWVTDYGDLLRYPVSHWRVQPPDPELEGEDREQAEAMLFARAMLPKEVDESAKV